MTVSITRAIAEFAVDTKVSEATGAVAVAKLSLLDWSTVAVAGLNEPVSRIVRNFISEEAGAGEASAFGLLKAVPARAAALSNGTLSHALDFDDTHFAYIGHPSTVVYPAALAVAEKADSSACAFVESALIGMETACRIGAWLGSSHYSSGFHQTATAGAFGAAAACARLLGLSVGETCQALGIVSTRASGIRSQFGTMGKPFNAGIAASNAVEAALLAKSGFLSRADGLECDQGFAATHSGAADRVDEILSGLGERYWFEDVHHKLYACCHGTHAAVEAVTAYRKSRVRPVAEIERIRLQVNPVWARVCNIQRPRTGLEAKFSYKMLAAMALTDINLSAPKSFSDELCERPDLLHLQELVQVEFSSSVGELGATLLVEHRGGSTSEQGIDLSIRDPQHTRLAKIEAKIDAVLPKEQAAIIRKLEHCVTGREVARNIASAVGMAS